MTTATASTDTITARISAAVNGNKTTTSAAKKPAQKKPYYQRESWKSKTDEERKEERKAKLKAAHETLTKALQSLETKEAYKEFLQFLGQFHQYSFKNSLYLKAQAVQRRQGASGFYSFKAWTEKGRAVRKGEKAYQVFAPLWINSKQFKTYTDPDTGEEVETNIPKWFNCYKLVPVFAYEQTEGEPLEFSNPWTLKGNGKTYQDIFSRLQSVSAVPVIVDPDWITEAGCKGVYSQNLLSGREEIRISASPDDAEKIAVLIHELAHSICDKIGNGTRDKSDIKEIRADSTAYCVCHALGIDTGKLNLIYLGNWTNGNTDIIEKLGTEVQQAAHLILSAIETGDKIDRASWKEFIKEERKAQRAEARAARKAEQTQESTEPEPEPSQQPEPAEESKPAEPAQEPQKAEESDDWTRRHVIFYDPFKEPAETSDANELDEIPF